MVLGPLPRLHRRVLLIVCVLTGALIGAWVADHAATRAAYSCADVLAGVCLTPTVNLVPVLAGAGLGALTAFGLLHRPDPPQPAEKATGRQRPRR